MSNTTRAFEFFMMRESWLKNSKTISWKQICLQWSTLEDVAGVGISIFTLMNFPTCEENKSC